MAEQTYSWAYSLVDSSQVSTFLISILLIVYGSFRSLNMDFENQDKEKDSNSSSGSFNGNSTNNSIQTIDSTQALFLPIGASVSLLVMFFFFDSVQVVFTICTAVLATIAFAFLLLPMCQYLTRPCSPQNKISFGCCGRFTAAELLSFSLSVMLVLIWVLTGHWLLMDALAMGLCVAMIAFVRLPSLKVSCLLLSGLLIYDVFWVFFSAYIFNSNVMVKVATQPADNPLDVLSRKLHLGPNVGRDVPRLSLPGKLVFPRERRDCCSNLRPALQLHRQSLLHVGHRRHRDARPPALLRPPLRQLQEAGERRLLQRGGTRQHLRAHAEGLLLPLHPHRLLCRSAHRHGGVSHSPSRAARPPLPGALYPPAAAHHGLLEG
ncbi:signal peptide peptidase-like 3 isoform X2 [Oryctolagus cuniculus]|uniref:signal peptide peptidase-like 3 isoform X2 n=1 Tax=Oryctolagus cuniculus TaxID=9986 RepID=UPI0022302D25|nr:signal peptide peptidase-like 3 isoform X2 [Oryctolagus cuniculus]XP_051691811.1 signal peptide peptidase-like 3 isoform X2 [Oryctolagus cuniculus]